MLVERGYDPVHRARPLQRLIKKEVLDRVARSLLDGALADGDAADVVLRDGHTQVVRRVREEPAAA